MFAKPINGGLWLVVGLPLFAILASLHVTFVAFTRGDATLPDEYHWEGMQLDRDFAGAQRAAALDVRATLRLLSATGDCQVTLGIDAAPPPAIELNLVHGTRPELDRRVRLARSGQSYTGECGSLPSGHWHVELTDLAGSWSVREDVTGVLDGAGISARPHVGS